MEPIVPAGLFVSVSGSALTLESTFAERNTNPKGHIMPWQDMLHYISDIVEG